MKYYIIAGESSGDLYGGLLMEQIKQLDTNAQFKFWGGDKMRQHSTGQIKSIKDTAFMGFYEVAKNIFKIKELFKFAKYTITKFSPDIVILIDYPGFNLRLTKWLKEKNIKTAFYISPQLWAWKEKRHKILRDNVDLFFVILPFEKDFYLNLDTPCIYHGHPLLEIIPEQSSKQEAIQTIGLFPGSRQQEINQILPVFKEFINSNPHFNYKIAAVSHIPKKLYSEHLDLNASQIDIVYDDSYDVMKNIDVALACSGTTTLELALFDVPQIVVYKTSNISFAIGKRLVKTEFISLVNLIAQKEVVTELLQDACNHLAIQEEFEKLKDKDKINSIKVSYAKIRADLGAGKTSKLVARDVFECILKVS